MLVWPHVTQASRVLLTLSFCPDEGPLDSLFGMYVFHGRELSYQFLQGSCTGNAHCDQFNSYAPMQRLDRTWGDKKYKLAVYKANMDKPKQSRRRL